MRGPGRERAEGGGGFALSWSTPVRARLRPVAAFQVRPPCYFNTGCCSFPDGDVTGLEIADEEIRLVRWPANLREIRGEELGVDPQRRILETEDLEHVFAAVSGEVEAEAHVVERQIAPG